MLTYLVTAEARDTIDGFLDSWGASLRDFIDVQTYEEVARTRSLPRSNYVFTDLERLSRDGLARADRLWNMLRAADPALRLLNRPAHHLGRRVLLERLHHAGINDFTAHRADMPLPETARFPLFLRYENEHWGPMSEPLATRVALQSALFRARLVGHRRGDLILVEYRAEPAADGAFRKAGAFVAGGTIVPRHLMHSSHWAVRDFDRVDAKTIEEERRYLVENPHAAVLRRVAELAAVDYGRIDYGIAGDRLRVWEINTNPIVMEPPEAYAAAHLEVQRLFAERMIDAFRQLAGTRQTDGEIALDAEWWSEPWPSRSARRVRRRVLLARRTRRAIASPARSVVATTPLTVRLRRLVDVERLLLVEAPAEPGPLPPGAREASSADIDALVDLYGRGHFAFQTRRRRRRIARRIDRGDIGVVLHGERGSIVACAWIARAPLRLDRYRLLVRATPQNGYLYGLRVAEHARRRGLAEQAIVAAHSCAARRGVTVVSGHISPRNPATPHLFVEKRRSNVVGSCTVLVVLDRVGIELVALRRTHVGSPEPPLAAER